MNKKNNETTPNTPKKHTFYIGNLKVDFLKKNDDSVFGKISPFSNMWQTQIHLNHSAHP